MRVLLGHISTAHGIRGEVIIKSYTDDPVAIAGYGPLSDKTGQRTFEIETARAAKKGVIARLAGIRDRNAAEALRGTELYVDRDKLPEPDEDEIYHADLVGLIARRADGTEVGEVVALQNFGAGDLLEIRLAGQRRTEFVPFNEAFVPDIDIEARRLVVIMPDDVAGDDGDEGAGQTT